MIYRTVLGIVIVLSFVISSAKAQTVIKSEDVVKVTWLSPDDFRDVKSTNHNKKYQQRVLKDLEKHFYKKLPTFLDDGQSISVKVHDLDMAGDVLPSFGRTIDDIRVVKSIYPPMIDIEYSVVDKEGKVLKSERKKFRDIAFNMGIPRISSKHLGYEKAMLDKWMKNELQE